MIFMFMGKLSHDKDESEDKHSSCLSFLENGPYEKKDKNLFKKMLIILCKEHHVNILLTDQFRIFFSSSVFYTSQKSIKRKEIRNL